MPLDGTFYHRFAITAAALASFRLGTYPPFPGLDAERVAQVMGNVTATSARLSIFALGLRPLLNALPLIEGAKLLFPGVLRWELADARNGVRLGRIGVGLRRQAMFACRCPGDRFGFVDWRNERQRGRSRICVFER